MAFGPLEMLTCADVSSAGFSKVQPRKTAVPPLMVTSGPVPVAALGFIALAWLASPYFAGPGSTSADDDAEPVTFAQAYEVIAKRCVSCHAQKPADENFDTAPKNVKFDTPQQIKGEAARIRAVSVLTRTMPLGNQTKMTQAERVLLGRWIADGAEIE